MAGSQASKFLGKNLVLDCLSIWYLGGRLGQIQVILLVEMDLKQENDTFNFPTMSIVLDSW
jgi:hypothetical protein